MPAPWAPLASQLLGILLPPPSSPLLLPCAPPPAEPGIFDFVDESTNTKVTLNTDPKGFDDAAAECRKQGGQLVAWDSYDDQYNAENFYVELVRACACVCGGGRRLPVVVLVLPLADAVTHVLLPSSFPPSNPRLSGCPGRADPRIPPPLLDGSQDHRALAQLHLDRPLRQGVQQG